MNAKRYFKIDTKSHAFASLNPKEKILVTEGLEIVKKYIADKAKADNQKNFEEVLSGMVKEQDAGRNDLFMEKLVKYALECAGEQIGENFDIACVKNPMIHKNPMFTQKFNAVLAQIITPIVPAIISTEYMGLADVANIGWGETAKFQVRSNDTYFVTKYAEGILDGSVQRLYNSELVVNPEPYGIKTTVDWYQVAAGIFDLGDFVYKIGASFSNYISLMIVAALKNHVTANPGGYFVNGFSSANWAKMAELVSAANGGAHVNAYGTLTALMSVLPGTGASSVVLNLQQGLGKEWTEVGYLGRYFGVDTIRTPQIILPGTVNSMTAQTPLGLPDDTIYFFADGGYKPVKLVFEGSTLTLDIIPTDSPDKEMGVDVQMRMGMTLVNASKFGAITGIVAPTGA